MSTTETEADEDRTPRCDTCGQLWPEKNMTPAELAEWRAYQAERWARVVARNEARIERLRAEGKIPPAKAAG